MINRGTERLDTWAKDLGGVFTLADLRVLYGNIGEAGVYKKIERMISANELVKVRRGLYALPTASLGAISARIDPSAYVSTGTALSRHLLIGPVPARRLQAVKVGTPRTCSCELGVIEHLSIAPHLFFGFEVENGIRMATPEKAWLDTCYYAYKGKKFSFDLDTDVNRGELNESLLSKSLEAYDLRFRSYYDRTWKGK